MHKTRHFLAIAFAACSPAIASSGKIVGSTSAISTLPLPPVPPAVSPETISAILGQTANALATANTSLWIAAIAVALLTAIMATGGVIFQVIMSRQRRKFLEEISANIASDEEIQSEIVAKLLAHKSVHKHLTTMFSENVKESIETLVSAAVRKHMNKNDMDVSESKLKDAITANFKGN